MVVLGLIIIEIRIKNIIEYFVVGCGMAVLRAAVLHFVLGIEVLVSTAIWVFGSLAISFNLNSLPSIIPSALLSLKKTIPIAE